MANDQPPPRGMNVLYKSKPRVGDAFKPKLTLRLTDGRTGFMVEIAVPATMEKPCETTAQAARDGLEGLLKAIGVVPKPATPAVVETEEPSDAVDP